MEPRLFTTIPLPNVPPVILPEVLLYTSAPLNVPPVISPSLVTLPVNEPPEMVPSFVRAATPKISNVAEPVMVPWLFIPPCTVNVPLEMVPPALLFRLSYSAIVMSPEIVPSA